MAARYRATANKLNSTSRIQKFTVQWWKKFDDMYNSFDVIPALNWSDLERSFQSPTCRKMHHMLRTKLITAIAQVIGKFLLGRPRPRAKGTATQGTIICIRMLTRDLFAVGNVVLCS